MPEVVAVPLQQATDVWVIQNTDTDVLVDVPTPPCELIVSLATEIVAVIDTGKGDPGPMGPVGHSVVPFAKDGPIEVSVGSQPFRFPFDATVLGLSACFRIPNTTTVTFDLHVDGVTAFPNQANRPDIPGGDTDLPEITLNVPIVSGNRLTIDVDDTGGSFDGEDLIVFVRYVQAV